MYTQIWNKYLPIIRILLKKAIQQEQSFQLNTSDFEKSALSKKTGFSFTIILKNGRAERMSNLPVAGKDLAAILLEDPLVKGLSLQNEYHISMNKKMILSIQLIPKLLNEADSEVLMKAL
jgi:hypothetical protein